MTRFRPCIDLHEGRVKQIVGSSLADDGSGLRTNFISEHGSEWFGAMYRQDGLTGGHVIMLGRGNEEAARAALASYPGGLQIGGGITTSNAAEWIEAGASHVIVTSFLFDQEGCFQTERLNQLIARVGREKLVIDLSCKLTADGWVVAMNRWQTITDLIVDQATLNELASSCGEFLVHAVDVEGKCEGVDLDLVNALAAWSPIPVTYAGGVRNIDDLRQVDAASMGKVDVTVGSALDIFGGSGLRYQDCVAFNRRTSGPQAS